MKFGVDIHGVLSHKEIILPVLKHLKDTEHTLYVISGAPVIEQMIELSHIYKYDLDLFDGFYSIIEYLFPKYHNLRHKFPNIKIWKDWKNTWWIEPEKLWWSAKSKICEMNNIDFLIDDKLEYKCEYLNNRFILFNNISELSQSKIIDDIIKRIK